MVPSLSSRFMEEGKVVSQIPRASSWSTRVKSHNRFELRVVSNTSVRRKRLATQ